MSKHLTDDQCAAEFLRADHDHDRAAHGHLTANDGHYINEHATHHRRAVWQRFATTEGEQ